MAVAIDTFNLYRPRGYEGQVADLNVSKIDSGINTAASEILPGRFVAISGDKQGVANVGSTTTAAQIAGLAVRTPAMENNASNAIGYGQYDVVSLVKTGRVFVIANGGCTRGNTVFVNIKGALPVGSVSGATSADRVELTGVFFAETVADGELVEIKLDGNLVI